MPDQTPQHRPNVLFIMTDQQRFDTIAALGNSDIHTPNIDRLVRRGVSFTRAYSTCPVCIPARYVVRTGCEPPTTGVYENSSPDVVDGQAGTMEGRCGPYLPRRMGELGYRTWAIGKFHTRPRFEDLGWETQLYSEELFYDDDEVAGDAYASFIRTEHPEFDHIEQLHGERTEMYYMPQVSPLPAELTVESWAADRTIEQLSAGDGRPFFGMVSFVGPHPPFAPPTPFNRMYNPDRMPNPAVGDLEIDHADEQIPHMNYAIWADDISDARARSLRARYYGEISYIDRCLGRILDAVDARDDADNTLIAFFTDHGDMLGDHHAWQKECFFEASCRIPMLVSWPARLPADVRPDELVGLTDLFALATGAAGACEPREGVDLLGMLAGDAPARETLIGYYGLPGSPRFKVMVRDERYKYIFIANGGREVLFDLDADPGERVDLSGARPGDTERLRAIATAAVNRPNVDRALEDGALRRFPFRARPASRCVQMDFAGGATGFPDNPADVLD